MKSNHEPVPPENKNISIAGDVSGVVVVGNENTVNQTIIQKFFNIFKNDAETLEQRNRRILLNHVENAWIKGVLDASLHGAALLDLGIKPDPDAVKTYPWAIKKESTDETLPAGLSMLKIFDTIGMGRSLLILGAPGSGKTTMLLELARKLIAHAREDVTYPIPMVFNLASWTEKLTLANWLAQELNNQYSVPRKTAPDWVKGNKLLLLLDGLDEVRQESRAKCVEAVNAFRKEHGLTSLAVCSRSQDYADLNTKLSFEGAIEVQPLTQKQITEFFNRFGKEMSGIKQVLKKDSALREMAETPLFLSIMIMAYRDKGDVEILVLGDEKAQRKHLFDTYSERMFERPRLKNAAFKKQNALRWLSWLAQKMIENNQTTYLLENMQPKWLSKKNTYYKQFLALLYGLLSGLILTQPLGLLGGLLSGLGVGLVFMLVIRQNEIETVDTLTWDWNQFKHGLINGLLMVGSVGLFCGLLIGFIKGGEVGLINGLINGLIYGLKYALIYGLTGALIGGLIFGLLFGLGAKPFRQTLYPEQKITLSIRNSLVVFLLVGLIGMLIVVLIVGLDIVFKVGFTNKFDVGHRIELYAGFNVGLIVGLISGLIYGLVFGGFAVIQYYTLRYILARNNLLPWRLIPFLDHCVDLIFLRRVGGGYIFVHRLLMEHFAEMYVEIPTSKGN